MWPTRHFASTYASSRAPTCASEPASSVPRSSKSEASRRSRTRSSLERFLALGSRTPVKRAPRSLYIVPVLQRPERERRHPTQHVPPEFRELVVGARRARRRHGARDEAVPFEPS